MRACPDDEQILAFIEDRLPGREGDALEGHLATCDTCRTLVARLGQTLSDSSSLEISDDDSAFDAALSLAAAAAPTDLSEALTQSVLFPPSEPRARAVKGAIDPSAEREPGPLRVGPFELLRLLGSGGMGEVYLARDTRLGRKVALKRIRPDALTSPEARERFFAEARTTARFNYPGIVTVYEVGEEHGHPYLALEYVEGKSLREHLKVAPLPLPEVLRIALAVADALAVAHGHGVLHRDLTPANVMLTRDGEVRVLDFGLASSRGGAPLISPEDTQRSPEDPQTPPEDTQTPPEDSQTPPEDSQTPPEDSQAMVSQLCGSPPFIAPELWRRRGSSSASDVWSFGVLLYQLVSGELPFHGAGIVQLARVICSADRSPELPPSRGEENVPLVLRELVGVCLNKDPTQRPSAEDLVTRLRVLVRHDPALAEVGPFRGLEPFDEHHRHLFFGRGAEVTAFVKRLDEEPLAPVVGASGAGKSSFVRAGVIPRLREHGELLVLALRPGRQPILALARRLLRAQGQVSTPDKDSQKRAEEGCTELAEQLAASPPRLNMVLQRLAETSGKKVLLFVDQLEELFAVEASSETQRRFLQALAGAADDPAVAVRVVFTLREEFLSRAAEGLGSAALARITVLRRPGREMLLEALRRPVEALGYRYDDSKLVDEMVAEVSERAACLPLLQFAGQLLWEQRDRQRRELQAAPFRRGGGVAGALARHADAVLAELPLGWREHARTLLLRLVSGKGTRRLLSRKRLLEGLETGGQEVLVRLRKARLVSEHPGEAGEEEQLELAHESLVETWEQLRQWIAEGRQDLAFRHQLEEAAALWESRGARADEVWRGAALDEALRRAQRLAEPVSPTVQRFLDAGERRRLQTRRARRLRIGVAFITLAIVAGAATAAAVTLWRQKRQVERQRAEAMRESARAAHRFDDLLQARARLRQAMEARDAPLDRALWWKLEANPLRWRRRFGAVIHRIAFAPAGDRVAAAAADHRIYIVDVRTRAVLQVLRGHEDQVLSVAFSPDGSLLVSGAWDGALRVWRRGPGGRFLHPSRKLGGSSGPRGGIWGLAFSPDGASIAAGGAGGSLRLWDVASGKPRRSISGHESTVFDVAFGPRGELLASASGDRSVRLWQVSDGKLLRRLTAHGATVRAVAFDASGRYLASGGDDRLIRLWDLRQKTPSQVLAGHQGPIWGLAFGAHGRLASASKDKTARVWKWATGELERVLPGHRQMVWGLAFQPRGQLLVTGSTDNEVRLWDLRGGHGKSGTGGHVGMVVGVDFSPDGRLLASGGKDRSIRLWEVSSGREVARLQGHRAKVWAVAFSPDGRTLASGASDRTVRLWDVAAGRQRKLLLDHTGAIFDLRYSADGKRLVSAGNDGGVRVWEAQSGRLLRVLRGHRGQVHGVALKRVAAGVAGLDAEGYLVASGGADRTVRLWDAAGGRQLALLRGHSADVWGVDLRGGALLSGSADQTLRRWDLSALGSPEVVKAGWRVYWPALRADGRGFAAATSGGVIKLCSADPRRCRDLRAHRAEVNVVRFAKDGRTLASSGDDSTVRTWRLPDAKGFHGARALWRTTALLTAEGDGPLLHTHRGWERLRLDGRRAHRPSRAWQRAVAAKARFAQGIGLRRLCLVTAAGLELWDRVADRRLATHRPSVKRLWAHRRGCLVQGKEGKLSLYPWTGGAPLTFGAPVATVGLCAKELWAVRGQQAEPLLASAAAPVSVGAKVTALAVGRRWLVVGRRDGTLGLVDRRGKPARVAFEDTPASPVLHLGLGAAGTVAAGFGDGTVGLWNLASGRRLAASRLHGAVQVLVLRDGRLHAASELGDALSWDLRALDMPYCQLLKRVWERVPVVWRQGRAVLQPPPAVHRCR